MSAQTGIEWCDSTFNPWIGCTKVSPACDHCYAERRMANQFKTVTWGAGQPRKRTSAKNWKGPKDWNEEAFYACGCGYRGTMHQMTTNAVHGCGLTFARVRRRVFCASLADWLDNEVPIEWFVDLLDLIRRTPNLDWLVLTKRIGNLMPRLRAAAKHRRSVSIGLDDPLAAWINKWHNGAPPPNAWIGATVVNQDEADRDVPKLLAVPAHVRFLSIEPMLGSIDLRAWIGDGSGIGASTFRDAQGLTRCDLTGDVISDIDWIICGGESGPHARPMHPDWVRSLRDQCAAAGVPLLFKQWGEFAEAPQGVGFKPGDPSNVLFTYGGPLNHSVLMQRIGKKAAGRLLDGRAHDNFPEVRNG